MFASFNANRPGEMIIQEGDLGRSMFFIKQGVVEILQNTGQVI